MNNLTARFANAMTVTDNNGDGEWSPMLHYFTFISHQSGRSILMGHIVFQTLLKMVQGTLRVDTISSLLSPARPVKGMLSGKA